METNSEVGKSGLQIFQIRALGSALNGTRKNVFDEAQRLGFNVVDGDAMFDELKEYAAVAKCEQCGRWMNDKFIEEGFDACSQCLGHEEDEF